MLFRSTSGYLQYGRKGKARLAPRLALVLEGRGPRAVVLKLPKAATV